MTMNSEARKRKERYQIQYRSGDLIKSDEPVIAHGCNTKGAMGAGIAKQVAQTYPDVEIFYRKSCHDHNFPLGSVQPIWTRQKGVERLVINLATQIRPGADASAWGIFLAFSNLAEQCNVLDIPRVAIPRIGAGIGGLSWSRDVVPAIYEAMSRTTRPLDIVVYDLEPWQERN